jgi:drug/metabolite transporter (DMT)-like permease
VDRRKGLLVLAFCGLAVAWGLNYPFVRVGLETTPPLWLAFFRAGVGLLGVALLSLWSTRRVVFVGRERRDALLLGLLNTSLFFGLWFLGASSVPPGETSVIIYTFPLWVSLLSAPLLHRPLRGLEWASVLAGFLGIVLVTQVWTVLGPQSSPVSLLEILGAAVSWALATVLFKRRFTGRTLWRANGFQLLGGTAGLLVAALLLEPGGFGRVSVPLIGVVLYMGLIGTAVAYAIWFELLERFPAATLSNYTFAVPVVALAASALLFGERLSVVQAGGVVLVALGIFLTGRGSQGVPPPE